MKTWLGVALFASLATACVDTASSDEATREISRDELVSYAAPAAVEAPAHPDCGEMLYCSDPQFHRPEYKCYSGTGCTDAQIQSDIVSDCDYVCGKSACSDIDLTNCPF
jgi:hypothetical protein